MEQFIHQSRLAVRTNKEGRWIHVPYGLASLSHNLEVIPDRVIQLGRTFCRCLLFENLVRSIHPEMANKSRQTDPSRDGEVPKSCLIDSSRDGE